MGAVWIKLGLNERCCKVLGAAPRGIFTEFWLLCLGQLHSGAAVVYPGAERLGDV